LMLANFAVLIGAFGGIVLWLLRRRHPASGGP
jgi:hypothetical protein